MRRKRILIDLSILKNIHCGLGQIALNYGKYYHNNYKRQESSYDLYLLVPKNYDNKFGSEVRYITTNWWRKHFLFLIPFFDSWHAIHQLSHYRPVYRRTDYILSIHDLNFLYEKNKQKKNKMLRRIQKKFDRATRVICISEFSRSEVLKNLNCGQKEITVIHNAVENLTLYAQSQPAFTNTKEFFFSIGEVKRKKNFGVLLDLMKYYPERELYIAGNDSTCYAEELRKQIEEREIKNVHLVGKISDKERAWLYANCKAFLFPSLYEGFGLPVIEAMMFGKPVFTSRSTSLEEIGNHHAIFWDNFNTQHMHQTIERELINYYQTAERKENELNYAHSFTYEKHMKSYMEVYKNSFKTKKTANSMVGWISKKLNSNMPQLVHRLTLSEEKRP